MNGLYIKFKHLVYKNKLTFAMVAVVFITLASTVGAVYIYVDSGVSQLDLSRPDYKAVREKVGEDDVTANDFKPAGPVNAEVLNDFLQLYRRQQQALTSASDFGGETLSDSSLQLEPGSDSLSSPE